MTRQFLAAPASEAAVERLFLSAGKMHDDLKKSTSEDTLEDMLPWPRIIRMRERGHLNYGLLLNLHVIIYSLLSNLYL